jgi:hypothetical protein
MPVVILNENDYRVISECKGGKDIIIPELEKHFPGMTNEYFVRSGETVCRVIKDGATTSTKSCFYINSPSNHSNQ